MSSFGPSLTARQLPVMPQASSIRAEVPGQWLSSSMASDNDARIRWVCVLVAHEDSSFTIKN